ncbi:hypothetical protein HER10_EVM0005356 [Colletotrichum scovillei]|uniref:uncharacterized protein n=1 Tax=Colletotrichum scovillei TaxID=1209932 RepID=UPI0015C3FB1F|nr:uncharacterized protein HER10_EVM0005356 [Colletotrichum scovillei]KAF4772903.1 hypothetical protein HER10_EVM0005356 [Colletotrichum scovillei]
MSTFEEYDVAYADNKNIHYLAAGPVNGPLLIFVHGWPAIALAWKPQLEAFSALGFRAIAPDMPGYGKSTARKVIEDYSQQSILEGLLALLAHTGRKEAVWIGHDWGSPCVSTVAAQHPEVVKALVNVCVPYRTLDLGLNTILALVDRQVYPEDQYPYGQWDYMRHYEEDFEKAIAWYEKDIEGINKALWQPGKPVHPPKPTFTSTVRKDGGWFGGIPQPPSPDQIPAPLLEGEVFDEFTKAMKKTGYWPGSAYYMNHERNHEFNSKAPNDGKFDKPALLIHAAFDYVCETKTTRLAEPMRQACSNLTEVTIQAGHWANMEKPAETSAALSRFILEEVPDYWPGFWDSGYAKRQKSVL